MPNTRTSIAPFLAVLREAVSRLPNTVLDASINDPIYQNFHNRIVADHERAFQTFERAYQRCFQPDSKGPLCPSNVMRGENGMDLVVSYLEELAKYPTMNPDELKHTALRVQQLVDLVHQRIKEAPKLMRCNSGGRKATPGAGGGTGSRSYVAERVMPKNRHFDPYDADYTPGADLESSEDELDMEAEKESGILGFGRLGGVGDSSKLGDKDRSLTKAGLVYPSDTEDPNLGRPGPKPGRSPEKGDWAMSQFDEMPTAETRSSGAPIWTFRCKWCRASRNVPRTPGCTSWEKERVEMKAFSRSNFISHSVHCRKLPFGQQYDKTRSTVEGDTTTANVNTPTLSQREFSSALAKAVVRDNHSMTFGEGDGMIQLFGLILPNIWLPSHQTLQRHLYQLFDVLGEKVKNDLKAIKRHAIATDAWTSKSSIYAIAAVILFFIDQDWRLRELVLDVINLDVEHSGAHMGKLVYRSLKSRETAHRAIACVTDNASANAVMNDTLAQRIQERENTHVHGKGMSFTCVNHAFHLVCTDILSYLGVIEAGDHYSDVKGSEIALGSESEEDEGEVDDIADADSDSDSDSDSEDDLLEELGLDIDTAQEDGVSGGKDKGGASGRHRQLPKVLNVVEKVHEIAVYTTASPKRRKKMHQIVAQTCPKETKHLSVKKSMRVRWGSAWEESKRAIELRPAFVHLVANLDSNKPRGKALNRARKLQERWTIMGEEWDLLAVLVDALSPFHTATEEMSRRDVSTLAEVLPTFALLERKLIDNMSKLRLAPEGRGSASAHALLAGLKAGLAKLQKYQKLAHQNDLCLIATVLHPRLRLKYLERWPSTHARASTLFTYVFENYHAESANAAGLPANPAGATPSKRSPSKSTNSWNNEIYADIPSFVEPFDRELHSYFSGSHPCPPDMDTLSWWKIHNLHFPAVADMARDFLCIPAASVSVERLFSQCKLTMTDVRSSMSFETARRRICCQHWMKAGVDTDLVPRYG